MPVYSLIVAMLSLAAFQLPSIGMSAEQGELGFRLAPKGVAWEIVEVTPGARMQPLTDTTAEARKRLERPDALVLQQVTLVVTIDAIDASTGMVTYHDVSNRRVQRMVQQRQLMEGIKAGDVVTLRQTRAQAVSIEKRP